MLNIQLLAGGLHNLAYKVAYGNRLAKSAVIEAVFFRLFFNYQIDEAREIVGMQEIALLLARSPDRYRVPGRHYLGDGRTEDVTALQVEFVVCAVNVAVAYGGEFRFADAGEKLA